MCAAARVPVGRGYSGIGVHGVHGRDIFQLDWCDAFSGGMTCSQGGRYGRLRVETEDLRARPRRCDTWVLSNHERGRERKSQKERQRQRQR